MVKLCIFAALVAGYPLPELSMEFLGKSNAKDTTAQATRPREQALAPASAVTTVLMNAETEKAAAQAAPQDLTAALPQAEPQGAAAARAAAALDTDKASATQAPVFSAAPVALLPSKPVDTAPRAHAAPVETPTAVATPALAVSAAAPVVHDGPGITTAPVADAAAAATTDDKSWWSSVAQLTSLPFPRLGLDQVAHAATLDAPPSPAMPAPGGNTSPFTPPAQQIPAGVGSDGAPIPLRSNAQPQPAGTAGPQLNPQQGQQGGIPALLTPNNRPPTPRVDSYTPPEDPNRKQQELARREQDVLVLKQQMEQRLEELQAAERKVQALLEEAKEAEAKKVSRLSAMYINMKPKMAAKALESMDERTAVKILAGMSPKQSGEILTYADPVKTAKLTELISRMRTGQ